MNPKYSVGEVVILQSIDLPQYNGEYTILKIIEKDALFTCRISTEVFQAVGDGYSYIFEEVLTEALSYNFHKEINWCESALRKKHEGSNYSFSELMSTLKIGEKA